MSSTDWFVIDRKGFAQTLAGKSKAFIFYEALQDAFDEDGVTEVRVCAERIPNSPFVRIEIEDDAPEGWADLRDAYTLYKPSYKKGDPGKAGVWNEGIKKILSLARYACIKTTKGRMEFDEEKGRRLDSRVRTERGSVLTVEVRMTDAELTEALDMAELCIPPKGVTIHHAGLTREREAPVRTFEAVLQTVKADEEGILRMTRRKATVDLYEPFDVTDEEPQAWLHELGIPVVPINCEWTIDVRQRVPLNRDRDNVTPAYLKRLLGLVVEEMAREIEDASATWVQAGVEDDAAGADATKEYVRKRFGENAVMHSPASPEASKRAQAEGRRVVYGREVGKVLGDKIRRLRSEGHNILPPAPTVTPSTRDTWEARSEANPDAPVMDPITHGDLKDHEQKAVKYLQRVGAALLGYGFPVEVYPKYPMGVRMRASWSQGGLMGGSCRLSLYRPGMRDSWLSRESLNDLLIHELAHQKESDHLSERYYDELTRLGARLVELALTNRNLFRW